VSISLIHFFDQIIILPHKSLLFIKASTPPWEKIGGNRMKKQHTWQVYYKNVDPSLTIEICT